MENQIEFQNKTFSLSRYPKTKDHTLKPWSNAEVYALNSLDITQDKSVFLYNDRFGFWNTTLAHLNPTTVWLYASQKKAININLLNNKLSVNSNSFINLLQTPKNSIDIALVKVPKSIDLFDFILEHIHKNSNDNTEVVCCFMTKYFNKSILLKAEQYFEVAEQSLAWKKSRLLTLRNPKNLRKSIDLKEISFKNNLYKQYPGVFSSSHIDYATQFLIEHLSINEHEIDIMDLASGNGILAKTAQLLNPKAHLTLMDDSHLAIESSKLNLNLKQTTFICNDTLEDLEDNQFDLVISNPPFHIEHENNIEVTLNLMKNIQRCLKAKGRFIFVANRHLNYKTHLMDWFLNVKDIAINDKFIIIECSNSL